MYENDPPLQAFSKVPTTKNEQRSERLIPQLLVLKYLFTSAEVLEISVEQVLEVLVPMNKASLI